jgi:hypothetical protein
MTFLEIALRCAQREWRVFPCIPGHKEPMIKGGFLAATNNEAQIRAWWTSCPEANVGISCRASGLAVLDSDHGFETEAQFWDWHKRTKLPDTYTVHTGRRFKDDGVTPEFGVHMYFGGQLAGVGRFEWEGAVGQVKSMDGYVMAAGCIHPSGERYEVLVDVPVIPVPDSVQALRTVALPLTKGPMQQIPEGAGRHAALTSFAGKCRATGFDKDAIYEALLVANPRMCAVPVRDEDLKHIAQSVCRYAVPEPEPQVIIGKAHEQPEAAKLPERVRPVYPMSAWDGTVVGEFAKLCANDNNVPEKM